MKEADTGALLVVDGDELKGIVTDRDIVVNAIAEGKREKKVRRLPVVDDDGEPIGIVSLGDLAIEADDDSALKEIRRPVASL
jgi:CBS domain-containing protein